MVVSHLHLFLMAGLEQPATMHTHKNQDDRFLNCCRPFLPFFCRVPPLHQKKLMGGQFPRRFVPLKFLCFFSLNNRLESRNGGVSLKKKINPPASALRRPARRLKLRKVNLRSGRRNTSIDVGREVSSGKQVTSTSSVPPRQKKTGSRPP